MQKSMNIQKSSPNGDSAAIICLFEDPSPFHDHFLRVGTCVDYILNLDQSRVTKYGPLVSKTPTPPKYAFVSFMQNINSVFWDVNSTSMY
jgi:hypothetical protein